MRDDVLGFGVLALALMLPWTTWARLSAPTADVAMLTTPLLLFSLAALGALAWQVAASGDPWLGVFVALAAGLVLRTPTAAAIEVAQWVALGAVLLTAVRHLPAGAGALAAGALVVAGVAQAGYVVLQTMRLDPLFAGWGWTAQAWPGGTLGNPNWVAAFLAPLVPLASGPILLALLIGVILTHSTLGVVAALAGLILNGRRVPLARLWLVAMALVALWGFRGGTILGSARIRAEIWQLGVRDWWRSAPFLGLGPGAWAERIPALQRQERVYPFEWFVWAHSDLVQLAYEFGLAGLVCLGGWLIFHRAMWSTPWGGSLAALAIESAAFFPFHLASVAVLAIVIIGCATPRVEI